MGDTIVKMYQRQNYVINEDIIRAIKKNNLNIDQALLIIYFGSQNNHAMLDVEEIRDKFGMDELSIMQAFATLTEKNLISIKMKKNRDNKVEEIIDLTPLYESMAIEMDGKERVNSIISIFTTFEQEFGRPLSSMETSIINSWLDRGINEDLIRAALKEAIFNGSLTLKYIDAIISEWNSKGFKNASDVDIYLKKKNMLKKKKPIEKLYDYNWLDDDE